MGLALHLSDFNIKDNKLSESLPDAAMAPMVQISFFAISGNGMLRA